MTPQQIRRIKRFRKWWKINKTHRPSHHWLVKHSRRCIYEFASPPEVWDKVKQTCYRYTNSEYKKLSRSDAWFLWRVTHPLENDRVQRILATAAFLHEKTQEQQKS